MRSAGPSTNDYGTHSKTRGAGDVGGGVPKLIGRAAISGHHDWDEFWLANAGAQHPARMSAKSIFVRSSDVGVIGRR